MSHIFISYSRRNLDFAQKIVDALAADNLDTWIDWKSIPKGEDWEQEIYRGIEEADAFLFLISPDSVESEMCNKEIALATKNGKRILPIFIANVGDREIYGVTEKFLHKEQKEEISRRNFIICRQGKDDFEKAIGEIQTTIHTDYEWLKYHTELQVKALKWEQKKDTSRLLRGKELREAEQQLTEIRSQEDPQPTRIQREYILSSRKNEDRLRRRTTSALITGLVVMILLSVLAWVQRNAAVKLATSARANELAAFSMQSAENQTSRALLLAVEAFNKADTLQSISAMETALLTYPNIHQFYYFGQTLYMTRVNISPDGEKIVTQNDNNEIQIWDVKSGKMLHNLGLFPSILGLGFSVDGSQLILVSETNSLDILVWDVITKQTISNISIPVDDQLYTRFSLIAVSPDGQVIAISGCDHYQNLDQKICIQARINIIDPHNGELINKPWLLHTSLPIYLGFDLDNDSLISIGCAERDSEHKCKDYEVISISLVNGKIRTLDHLPANMSQPIDKFPFISLISASLSKRPQDWMGIDLGQSTTELTLCNILTKTDISKIAIPDNFLRGGFVQKISSSSDYMHILISGTSENIIVLDLNNGNSYPIFLPLASYPSAITNAIISWDGENFAASRTGPSSTDIQNEILISGSIHTQMLSNPLLTKQPISIIAGSPNGKYFATGICNQIQNEECSKSGIIFWDTDKQIPLKEYDNVHNGIVSSVVYSPDGYFLASGDSTGKIILWNAIKNEIYIEIPGSDYPDYIGNLAFSFDHKILVASSYGSDSESINAWNTQDLTAVNSEGIDYLNSCCKGLSFFSFSSNGKLLAYPDTENSVIYLLDTIDLKILNELSAHSGVVSVAFSPDDAFMISGSADGTIVFWETKNFKPITQPIRVVPKDHEFAAYGFSFSHDGNILAIETTPNLIFLSPQQVNPLKLPGNITLMDVDTHQRIGVSIDITGLGVSLSPNGKQLLTSNFIWNLDPYSWVSIACQRTGRNFTRAEWAQYFPDEEYHPTCAQWPLELDLFSTSVPTPVILPLTLTSGDSYSLTVTSVVNLNTATLEELAALPGINLAAAQKIIDYREQNGPFLIIEDIMNVYGIGPSTFESIKDLITVGP